MASINQSATGSGDGNGFTVTIRASGTISDTTGVGSLTVTATLNSTNNNFSQWTINCVIQETNATPNTIIVNNSVQRTLAKNSSLQVGSGTWSSSAYTGSKSIRLVATVDAPTNASYVPNNATVAMIVDLPTVAPAFSFTPFSFTPFSFTPFGFTPFGFTPFGFTPFGFTPAPPPAAPTNLSVTNITPTAFRFNWGSVSNATSYEVFLNSVSQSSSVTNTYYDFSNLVSGTSYTLGVRAINGNGNSSTSTITGTTAVAPGRLYQNNAWRDVSQFRRYDAATTSWVQITTFKRYNASTGTWDNITN